MGQPAAEKKFGPEASGKGPGEGGAGAGAERAPAGSVTIEFFDAPNSDPNGRGAPGFDWPALDAAREATHGDFHTVTLVAAMLRDTLRCGPRHALMASTHKVAADEICLKLARIVCGDPAFVDHWRDVAGYALKALAA